MLTVISGVDGAVGSTVYGAAGVDGQLVAVHVDIQAQRLEHVTSLDIHHAVAVVVQVHLEKPKHVISVVAMETHKNPVVVPVLVVMLIPGGETAVKKVNYMF